MVLLARLRAIHHLLSEHMIGSPGSLLLKHAIPASHLSSIVLTSGRSVRSIFAGHDTTLRQDLL